MIPFYFSFSLACIILHIDLWLFLTHSLIFFVHVQVWLQYQCLWDMQAENIYNRLGEDLTKWQALLVQIRKARGTFDNAETRKDFGPVIIDYGKVIKNWHAEKLRPLFTVLWTQNKFSKILHFYIIIFYLHSILQWQFLCFFNLISYCMPAHFLLFFDIRSNPRWTWSTTRGTKKSSANLARCLDRTCRTSIPRYPR